MTSVSLYPLFAKLVRQANCVCLSGTDHAIWCTLANKGYKLTDVKERFYFKAVYMAEPGNIIFEFATVGPGFTIDEPFDKLGRNLMLPPRLEEQREELERQLPTINI